MFGVLMAAMKHYWNSGFHWVRVYTPVTAVLFVLLCSWWFVDAPFLMQSRELQINLFTVQAILCALLLPWFDGLHSTVVRRGFFAITSELSYSLYLIHILVIIGVNRALGYFDLFDRIYNNPFILYPLYFSLFYFTAWLTYHRIEKPFLELRDTKLTWLSIFQTSWVALILCSALIFIF
mgnify:CR=1 FL=1